MVSEAPDTERPKAVEFAQELRSWRERRGLSRQALADRMAYDRTYVSHIEGCNLAPSEDFTRRADESLDAGGALWRQWEAWSAARRGATAAASRAVDRKLRTVDFVGWLADHSAAGFRETYEAVALAADRAELGRSALRRDREFQRAGVARRVLVEALTDYYGGAGQADCDRLYRARVGDRELALTILSERPNIAAPVPLGGDVESVRFVAPPVAPAIKLGEVERLAAVARMAEVEVTDTVMVNNPLYRLLDVSLAGGRVDATFTLADFATYALTADLLETELVDAICDRSSQGAPGPTPLRDIFMPTVQAASAIAERECVGGPVALLAIARPERPGRPRDYALMIQERSARVLNVTGKLAVIPKAFHQPTVEPAEEMRLATTLARELEEELLGRQDLEHLGQDSHRWADPLHAQHRSEPMTWLAEHRGTDAFRMECTGFGINLVSGNYEFACLLVIEDDSWWTRYGHLVEANWETMRVHRYSSQDADGLAALAADPRWSNEGLFSFIEGLRRLAELDEAGRVNAPPIDVEC